MNINYKLIRKNIKNIYIRISSKDGSVCVSAPYLCSRIRIDKFVESKKEWIELKQAEIFAKPFTELSKIDKEELKRKIEFYLPIWESKTGLFCSSWGIRDMKTRWGSCNTRTGKLNFNLQLVKYGDDCLQYVIIHELCHLKIHNHSKEFYNLLSQFMPDYKEIRYKLNHNL